MTGRVLLVLHKLGDSLGYYDVETGQELAVIPASPFPHEMTLSPDRTRVYAAEMGLRGVESEGKGGNTVRVFDIREKKSLGQISTGEHRRPHGITAHYCGKLFVTSEENGHLLIFDLVGHDLLHAVDTGQKVPHEVAVSHDGTIAYTANIVSGTLTAIDVEAGKALYNIPVLKRPEGMVFSPDGTYLYVVNRESDAVAVVDTGQRKMVGRIDTGRGPVRLVISPDGRYLAYPLFFADAMQIADTKTLTPIKTIAVGKQPAGTAISEDGRLLFVSCELENTVYVISMDDFSIVKMVATRGGPDAMICLHVGELD